jgi:hypothetical protein
MFIFILQARTHWLFDGDKEQTCLKPQQSINLAKPQITTVDSAPLFESLGSGYSEMSEFNTEPVQCWLCNLGFNIKGHRNVHIMEEHFPKESPEPLKTTSDQALQCPFCWVIAKTDLSFNEHLFFYHSKECHKAYLKPVNELVPPKVKPKPTCQECSKVFVTMKLLEKHSKIHKIKRHHPKTESNEVEQSKIHNIVVPNEKRPKQQSKRVCDLCGFVGSSSGYQSHMFYKHDQTDKAQVFCQKCDGKPFLHNSDLERHLAVKHDKVVKLCTHCGKKFSTGTQLKLHLAIAHKIDDVKRYKCKECNYASLRHIQLKRHVFIAHTRDVDTRFLCDYCGKNFFTVFDRKVHIDKSHLGVKKYHCEHCDYIANRPERIQQHTQYKHQDVSVRTCPICGTVEKSAADLLRHYESSHSGHPPLQVDEKYVFRCDLCNKILGSVHALFTHKRNTHDIKDSSIFKVRK